MKLALFEDFRLGVLGGEGIVDASGLVQDMAYQPPGECINELIRRFDEFRDSLERLSVTGPFIPLARVKLRPPVPRPRNIVCMAVNYVEEGFVDPPPIGAFLKSPNAIIGPEDTMLLPDMDALVFEGEAELGVVIGRAAKNVPAQAARGHIFGYVNFIDGSARLRQPGLASFFEMKSRDTFAPIGPYLVTADEVSDPQALDIDLSVNGVLKQHFNTRDMAAPIDQCIEWVSSVQTLEPGDILATGTQHQGLGALQDGDVVELHVSGLGLLRVTVRDELKRTWSRETRGERLRQGFGFAASAAPQLTGKYAAIN